MNLSHSETKQTLRIWTLMLSNTEGVAVTADSGPTPDVFVMPDEYDDEPNVLVEEDTDEAKWLMNVLNIDGVAE